jgi:nucleoside 2-deoxyribosyltransferase
MKTDFMVIGRVRNSESVNLLVSGIEDKGYTCYNFLSKATVPEYAHLSRQKQMEILESHADFWNDPLHKHHYDTDMDGLNNADTVVMLLPAGLAAHMEAGVAYGLGKKLILIGEPEKAETLYLMFSERYSDIESFICTI